MRQKNGWDNLKKRKIPFHLLVFVIRGTATFDIASVSYTVSEGDVLIIPANTFYFALTENFFEYYFFHFSGEVASVETPNFPLLSQTSFALYLLNRTQILFAPFVSLSILK